MKGIFEDKDFWTSNPLDASRRYIDKNAVVWVIELVSLGKDGTWSQWRARPESNPIKYEVKAGRWPVTAATAPAGGDKDQIRADWDFLADQIDNWVDQFEDKKRGGGGWLWLLLLGLLALGKKRR